MRWCQAKQELIYQGEPPTRTRRHVAVGSPSAYDGTVSQAKGSHRSELLEFYSSPMTWTIHSSLQSCFEGIRAEN